MTAYHNQTAPILQYYQQRSILQSIDAMQKIGQVTHQLDEILYKSIV
jgi:adenylate kinase